LSVKALKRRESGSFKLRPRLTVQTTSGIPPTGVGESFNSNLLGGLTSAIPDSQVLGLLCVLVHQFARASVGVAVGLAVDHSIQGLTVDSHHLGRSRFVAAYCIQYA